MHPLLSVVACLVPPAPLIHLAESRDKELRVNIGGSFGRWEDGFLPFEVWGGHRELTYNVSGGFASPGNLITPNLRLHFSTLICAEMWSRALPSTFRICKSQFWVSRPTSPILHALGTPLNWRVRI